MYNYFVRVSPEEMRDLLESRARLHALETGGVDNWSWYGDSFEDFLRRYGQQEGRLFESFEEVAQYELDNFYEMDVI